MKKVKLIWVFSGPDAENRAKDKLILLDECCDKNEIEHYSGTEYISHISWLTYLIVSEEDRAKKLEKLSPTREEDFDA
ncbi:MAG: hypothetical protein P8Q14_09465 [Vicingaceae bacterium]|nr:hypothetical protein [Vicingaceae bacterium]